MCARAKLWRFCQLWEGGGTKDLIIIFLVRFESDRSFYFEGKTPNIRRRSRCFRAASLSGLRVGRDFPVKSSNQSGSMTWQPVTTSTTHNRARPRPRRSKKKSCGVENRRTPVQPDRQGSLYCVFCLLVFGLERWCRAGGAARKGTVTSWTPRPGSASFGTPPPPTPPPRPLLLWLATGVQRSRAAPTSMPRRQLTSRKRRKVHRQL